MKKLKIAFLVSLFPRLSETFILNQITGLIDRGHEVDIYAYGPGDDPKAHEDVANYRLLDRTFYYGDTVGNMPNSKVVRLLNASALFLTRFHRNPRAFLQSLNVMKFKKQAANLSILHRVAPFFGIGDYDVIHCHFGLNGQLGILLKEVGVFTGKVITVFHGYDITYHVLMNGRSVYANLFEKGDLFLPISERWKNELISLGCSADKIHVHRMGIDTERYNGTRNKSEKEVKARILSVARLIEKKGINFGIEAIAKVSRDYPDIEYCIIGDGTLRGELESLIDRLQLKNRVRLLGWKSQVEIIEYMKSSDIFLAPSITGQDGDQEGIPVVLMEAMAMELPVVSTYHSGIPELVQDGTAGFLVPERDVHALSDRLGFLLGHPETWAQMGIAGRLHVQEQYDIGILNDRLVDLFREALN